MATLLSPAESLVLLKPNRTPAREAVKVTLLSLLAQGVLRIDEERKKWFFGTKKIIYLRPTSRRLSSLPPHAASLLECVRDAQTDKGTMEAMVACARRSYGSNLAGFKSRFIMPALLSRGLIEERVLLLLRSYRLTPVGVAEQSRIENDIRRIRAIPDLLRTNPAEAAAIALAVGGTILLVSELRPYYGQLSEAMRRHGVTDTASGDGGGNDTSFWSQDDTGPGHPAHTMPDRLDTDHSGLGSFDLSTFDAGAFSALDAGMDSFDSGFDSSAGGDSGGGDGGGDGGGGGGD